MDEEGKVIGTRTTVLQDHQGLRCETTTETTLKITDGQGHQKGLR